VGKISFFSDSVLEIQAELWAPEKVQIDDAILGLEWMYKKYESLSYPGKTGEKLEEKCVFELL